MTTYTVAVTCEDDLWVAVLWVAVIDGLPAHRVNATDVTGSPIST